MGEESFNIVRRRNDKSGTTHLPACQQRRGTKGKEQVQHWLTWLDLSVKKPNIRHLEGQTNGM
jgi:hypothetical protein